MRRNNFNADITYNMDEMGDFSQLMVIALQGAACTEDDELQDFVIDYVIRHKGELSHLDNVDARNFASGIISTVYDVDTISRWERLIDGLS